MLIKKDGFFYHEYGPENTLVVEGDRLTETIAYIRQANISRISLLGQQYRRTDLDFLRQCPTIADISIRTSTISDCTGLYQAENLNTLSLPENFVPLDLTRLPQLQALYGKIDIFQNIEYCTSLKTLGTTGRFPNGDFSLLCTLSNLEKLIITQGNLQALTGISKLRHLRILELNYLRQLRDIRELQYVPALTSLAFENCPHLAGYDILRTLKQLDTLSITKCAPIASLSFVRDLPRLQRFDFQGTNIEDGDLSPCEGVAHTAFDNKKHYSHTFRQLNPEWWQEQKVREKAAPTTICIMNAQELLPNYFVSILVESDDQWICKIKDNRGRDTIRQQYWYDKQKACFLDMQNGGCLPTAIANHPDFLAALRRVQEHML